MKELGFSSLTRMKDDCTTNSHYLTYKFIFKRLGQCTFRPWEKTGLVKKIYPASRASSPSRNGWAGKRKKGRKEERLCS